MTSKLIKPTEEDLIFIKTLLEPNSTPYRDLEVKDEGGLGIKISQMYETPFLQFSDMQKISDRFGTTNINISDTFGYVGCETCDYGSEYGYYLEIRRAN